MDKIMKRDKTSLDISWIEDKSLADMDSLPTLNILEADINENLQSGLDGFMGSMNQLKE